MLKVQQAAKYVPIEAIRTVQTDVIAIQAESIHQTGKQKSTSKNVGNIQVQGVELVENPTKKKNGNNSMNYQHHLWLTRLEKE